MLIPEWKLELMRQVKSMSPKEFLYELVARCSDRDGDICDEELGVEMLNEYKAGAK